MSSVFKLAILTITMCLTLSGFVYAQHPTPEMRKARDFYRAAELSFDNGQADAALIALNRAEEILGGSNEYFDALKIKILIVQEEFIEASFEIDQFYEIARNEQLIVEITSKLPAVQTGVELELENLSSQEMKNRASTASSQWHERNGVEGGPIALFWLESASKAGDADASNDAAAYYFEGRGIQKSPNEAIRYWQRASDQGHHSASTHLGLVYYNGEVVETDYKKAAEYFQLRSEFGEVAAYHLGLMYAQGLGVEKDLQEAELWLNHTVAMANRFEGGPFVGDDDSYYLEAMLYRSKAEEALKRFNLEQW